VALSTTRLLVSPRTVSEGRALRSETTTKTAERFDAALRTARSVWQPDAHVVLNGMLARDAPAAGEEEDPASGLLQKRIAEHEKHHDSDDLISEAAMFAELRRSVEAFPVARPETGAEVAALLAAMLDSKLNERRLVVLDGRVFAHEVFLRRHKRRLHAMMLASVARELKLPNALLVVDENTAGPPATTRDGRTPLPTLVIAKLRGYDAPGVLVPNPYFGGLDDWGRDVGAMRDSQRAHPFEERARRVFWRGQIEFKAGQPCEASLGNYVRLAIAALSVSYPDEFDVRCTTLCLTDYGKYIGDATTCDPERAFFALARAARDVSKLNYPIVTNATIDRADYAKWRYVLNLPGRALGSYSRNLNHLWFLGSVVLLHDAPYVEWYYPSLRNGVSHVALNSTTAHDVFRVLDADSEAQRRLARAAGLVGERLLCPSCLARYWRRTLVELRRHFRYGAVLDDPVATQRLFEDHLKCSPDVDAQGSALLELHYDPSKKGDAKLRSRNARCRPLEMLAAESSWDVAPQKEGRATQRRR